MKIIGNILLIILGSLSAIFVPLFIQERIDAYAATKVEEDEKNSDDRILIVTTIVTIIGKIMMDLAESSKSKLTDGDK